MLLSGAQQDVSVRSSSILGYYKVLSAVSNATQQIPLGYILYTQWCVYFNPKFINYPLPASSLWKP